MTIVIPTGKRKLAGEFPSWGPAAKERPFVSGIAVLNIRSYGSYESYGTYVCPAVQTKTARFDRTLHRMTYPLSL